MLELGACLGEQIKIGENGFRSLDLGLRFDLNLFGLGFLRRLGCLTARIQKGSLDLRFQASQSGQSRHH